MNDNIIPIKSHLRYRRLNTIAEGYLSLANDAAEGMRLAPNKYELANHQQRYDRNMRLFAKRRDAAAYHRFDSVRSDAS